MSKNKKWMNLATDSEVPTLSITDEIGGWGTWADEVMHALDNINAPTIKVRLFSPGGYVDEGIQIYNALRRHDARIIVEIDSLAASIASVIAMAGDEIIMADEAVMMIHDPWGGACGTAEDMRKAAEVLDTLKSCIIKAYRKRTGLDDAALSALMKDETWLTAEDAVELGFATKIETFEKETHPTNSVSARIVAGLRQVPEKFAGIFAKSKQPSLMLSPQAMARIATDSAAADNKAGAMPDSTTQEVIMGDKVKAAPQTAAEDKAKNAIERERERVVEISARADKAAKMLGKDKADALARDAIAKGISEAEFANILMDNLEAKASAVKTPIGLTDKEASAFSITRALAAAATGDWSNAQFEHEVVMATAQKLGAQYKKGIAIPTDVLLSRAKNVITTTVAAPTIQTDVDGANFIDILRNKMRVRQAGATVLEGLQGNVSVPRQTVAGSAQWVAEGNAATPADQAFDAVVLTPKGVAATSQISLQSLLQPSLGMEALVLNDLATVIALAADAAAINGSGTGATPRGILNTTGIGSVPMGANGAALSNVDALVDLETSVAAANADEDSMKYMTNAKVVGALKKLKTTTGEYLFRSEKRELPSEIGDVNGYSLLRTNQVPSGLTKGTGTGLSALIFGDWSKLMIGEWGALILDVEKVQGNPGLFNINALQFMDMAVRHPESFAAIVDIQA